MVAHSPQITSKDLQEHLAADGIYVRHSTIQCNLQKEESGFLPLHSTEAALIKIIDALLTAADSPSSS